MRPPRTISSLALVLLLVQTTGCHSFRPLNKELPSVWAEGMSNPRIRVSTQDHQKVELVRVSMDSVGIQGELYGGGPDRVTIPLEEVLGLEERHFSWKWTIIRTGATYLIVGGLFLLGLHGIASAGASASGL